MPALQPSKLWGGHFYVRFDFLENLPQDGVAVGLQGLQDALHILVRLLAGEGAVIGPQASARRTIKGRPAKAPARRAIKDSPKRHPARQKTSGKCTGKYRPAKTGPKDPLRTQHPERPPCKPTCGPKIAGKFGVPQQNRYLRTYRTTPAAGQYSRPSDRLPGKSTA